MFHIISKFFPPLTKILQKYCFKLFQDFFPPNKNSIDKNSTEILVSLDNEFRTFPLNWDNWKSTALYTHFYRSIVESLLPAFYAPAVRASLRACVHGVWKREQRREAWNEYSKRNSSPIPRLCVAEAAGGIEKRQAVSSSFDSLNGQIYSFPLIVFFLTRPLLLFL